MIRQILSALGLGNRRTRLMTRIDAGIATSQICREAVELSAWDSALDEAKRIADEARVLDVKMALASFDAIRSEIEQEVHRLNGELRALRSRVRTAVEEDPK